MSTLNVSNITDGTTTVGTEYVVNGSAKAWVNFNGTGTVAVRDSFNTSSITDISSGYYGQNFSTSFLSSDTYSTTSEVADLGWGSKTSCPYQDVASARLQMFTGSGSTFNDADANRVMMTHHGDLA